MDLFYISFLVLTTGAVELDCEFSKDQNGLLKIVYIHNLGPEIKPFFNISGTEGYIEARTESNCTMWNVSTVDVKVDTELGVYDSGVQIGIRNASYILGPAIKGIQAFVLRTDCAECFAFYFITEPVGLSMERWMADVFISGEPAISTVYSLWPSPSSFINCVVGNALLYTAHIKNQPAKVVILAHTQSEDAILFVSELSDQLRKKNMDVQVIDLYLISTIANNPGPLTAEENAQLNERLDQLYRTMFVYSFTHFVIFHMDDTMDMQVKTLNALLRKKGGLDTKGVTWFIADMEFILRPGSKEKIMEIDAANINLLSAFPCFHPEELPAIEMIQACTHPFAHNRSIEIQGMLTGKILMKNVFEHLSRSYKETLTFLRSIFQTDCPIYPNLTREDIQKSSDLLECAEANTVRRVGFPKFDIMVTQPIYTRDTRDMRAIYLSKDWLPELDFEVNATKRELVKSVHDFVAMGFSGDESHRQYAVLVEQEPFVMRGSDGSFSGMCVDVYNAALIKLVERGILLNLEFYNTSLYGSLNEGIWSGVFGELTKGNSSVETVLGLGLIALTDERADDDRFTFSPVIAQGSLTYMMKKIGYESYLQFLRPFSGVVWLMLLLVVVVSGVYLYLINALNPFREQLPEGSHFGFRECLWHSYLTVTQIGAPFGASYSPARVYSVFFWFFSLVVVGCYTGNLTGFLMEISSYVPDISELLKSGQYKFGMIRNSSISSTHISQVFAPILDSGIDYNKIEFFDSFSEGIEKVKRDNLILIESTILLEHFQNTDPDCELYVHYDPSFYGSRIEAVAFPMRSDWELADDFKWAINQLKESGELQIIHNKWIESDGQCIRKYSLDERRLNWMNFIGLFIVTAVGIVAAYISLALKLGHLKMKEKLYEVEKAAKNGKKKSVSDAMSVIELTEIPT